MKLIVTLLFLSFILVFPAYSSGKRTATPLEEDAPPVSADWFVAHVNDAARFAEIYPVSENNPFIFGTFEQLMTQLRYGTGVVVFGFPACPRCRNTFPVLEQAFKEIDMERHAGLRGRIL